MLGLNKNNIYIAGDRQAAGGKKEGAGGQQPMTSGWNADDDEDGCDE